MTRYQTIGLVFLIGAAGLAGCGGGGESVNGVPQLSVIADAVISANETAAPIVFTVNDDDNTDALTLTASSSDQQVIADQGLEIVGSGTSRTLLVTPVAGALGSATVSIMARDPGGRVGRSAFAVEVVTQSVSLREFVRDVFHDAPNDRPRDINSRSFIDDVSADEFQDLL